MDDYFIALIIITIVTFIISIVLSLYFVYVPVQRISRKFDDEVRQGIQVLDRAIEVASDLEDTGRTLTGFTNAFCDGLDDQGNLGAVFSIINDTGAFVQPCEFIRSCPPI